MLMDKGESFFMEFENIEPRVSVIVCGFYMRYFNVSDSTGYGTSLPAMSYFNRF